MTCSAPWLSPSTQHPSTILSKATTILPSPTSSPLSMAPSSQCQWCTPWTTTTLPGLYSSSNSWLPTLPSTPLPPPPHLQNLLLGRAAWPHPLLLLRHCVQSSEASSMRSKITGAPPPHLQNLLLGR